MALSSLVMRSATELFSMIAGEGDIARCFLDH
jgi:hypothetical protein